MPFTCPAIVEINDAIASHPRRARRQDRPQPPHERDARSDGAGDLQGLVRRFRPHAGEDGRPRALPRAGIWALFPDRLDDEGKPEGWEIGALGDYANLNPESWSRANYPSFIKYVDLSGTKWGTIENIEPHSREDAPSRAQRVLRPGDTIIGMVRPGNGSYAFVSEDGLTGSTGFAALRPIAPRCARIRISYRYLPREH